MSVVVPRTIEELTPSWFTGAFSSRWPGTHVTEANARDVIHGTATKVFVDLDYADGGSAGKPSSVCVKGPFEPHAEMMAATGIYESEALFFRDVRPEVPIAAPTAYYADVNPTTKFGVVVLEELNQSGAVFLGATIPVTADEVATALDSLASFHAAWWASSRLDELDWLGFMVTDDNPSGAYFKTLGPDVIATRLAQPTRGPFIPDELRDPDRIVQAFWAWVHTLPSSPPCLLHGDAHVGNSYRLPDGTMGFCDWQTLRRGHWAHDVSYFIGSALDPAERARSERDLLRHYLARLSARVVDAPSFDDAWTDYRRYMMYGFFAWLTNLEEFQPEAINTATIARFATAVAELDTYSTLDLP